VICLIGPKCNGLLIGQNSLDKINSKSEISVPGKSNIDIKIVEGAAKSPVNGEKMKVIRVNGVKIDVCVASNYIWFDQGELEQVLKKERTSRESISGKPPIKIWDTWYNIDFFGTLIEETWHIINN